MSEFKSLIAAELHDYLEIQKMTFEAVTVRVNRHALKDFDNYLAEHKTAEKVITEELINGWIQRLLTKNHSRTVSGKVSILRCFLRYLSYCGVPVFMPECPKWHEDYIPYIFSDEEMSKIFQCLDESRYNNNLLKNYQLAMLIRLLYGCGLRFGETLQLVRSDVDFVRETLLLRKPKNKKQRIVPMSHSLSTILMQYCVAMGFYEDPDAFLFPGKTAHSPADLMVMSRRFRKVLVASGIYVQPDAPGRRGQCIHCLRHLFAIKSFMQAEKSGITTTDSIPYLSVYLGHFDMDGTEKYLKFSSDIFPEYTEMFETYSKGVFSVLGGAK